LILELSWMSKITRLYRPLLRSLVGIVSSSCYTLMTNNEM
jgi:hypothetical protein